MDQLSTKILMIFAAIKDFFTFFINTIILKTKNVLFKIFKKFNLAPLCPPPHTLHKGGGESQSGDLPPWVTIYQALLSQFPLLRIFDQKSSSYRW